jgi:hypothetical protein
MRARKSGGMSTLYRESKDFKLSKHPNVCLLVNIVACYFRPRSSSRLESLHSVDSSFEFSPPTRLIASSSSNRSVTRILTNGGGGNTIIAKSAEEIDRLVGDLSRFSNFGVRRPSSYSSNPDEKIPHSPSPHTNLIENSNIVPLRSNENDVDDLPHSEEGNTSSILDANSSQAPSTAVNFVSRERSPLESHQANNNSASARSLKSALSIDSSSRKPANQHLIASIVGDTLAIDERLEQQRLKTPPPPPLTMTPPPAPSRALSHKAVS